MRRLWLVYLLGGACFAGCGGETLDVGSNGTHGDSARRANEGTGGTSAAADPPACTSGVAPVWPEQGVCPPGIDSPLVGSWRGPVSSTMFQVRYETITVDILAVSADGEVCGTVTYGDPLPLEPATNPEERYPPASRNYPANFGQGGGPASWGALPGATYTILRGTVASNHVELTTGLAEIYKSWCALQQSYAQDGIPGACNCLPNGSSAYTPPDCTLTYDGTVEHRSCDQLALCAHNGVCACDASGCTAAQDTPLAGSARLGLDFEGATASGTLQDTAEFSVSLMRL